MLITEYATTHCADIIAEMAKREEMFDLSGFSYDEVIKGEDGSYIPVIVTTCYQIPLSDILGLDRDEFAKVWPYEECLEAYDLYVSNLIILDGEDALWAVRNSIRAVQERVKAYDLIPEAFR